MGFSSGTFTYSGASTTFSAPTTGTTISSTAAAAAFSETATGLSTCLLKDGTQTATAAIPLAVAPSALTHAARVNELQNGYSTFLTSVAGTNTVTGTATPTPAYTVGQRFTFVPAVTNTGATTLNISSLGAGAVQLAGAALTGGELVASVPVTVYVTAATPVFEIIAPTQFPDSRALVVGATDSTKKVRFEADGITTGTTRVMTIPDRDLTLGPVIGTEVATTSGSSVTFTGIPSWVRKIIINFAAVSSNGTNAFKVQLGDGEGLETSGYSSSVAVLSASAVATGNGDDSGFFVTNGATAAGLYSGQIILCLEDPAAFTWTQTGTLRMSAEVHVSAGLKALSAVLTQVAVLTADTLDAGAVNILYE